MNDTLFDRSSPSDQTDTCLICRAPIKQNKKGYGTNKGSCSENSDGHRFTFYADGWLAAWNHAWAEFNYEGRANFYNFRSGYKVASIAINEEELIEIVRCESEFDQFIKLCETFE